MTRLVHVDFSDGEFLSEPVNIKVGNLCKPGKVRLYNEDYLTIGFTWSGNEKCPLPECVICGEKLSNASMVLAKLKRHFYTKHIDLANKTMEYFKRLREEHQMQSTIFQKNFQVNDKTQVTSYLVAELVAKQMKAHTIAESLILPACQAIVKTMFELKRRERLIRSLFLITL